MDKARIVFLCVHNAGRSQMAAGWARHLAGGRVEIFTGGSEPAPSIDSAAVDAMAEAGIDISGSKPGRWTEEIVREADVVVTMGCGDSCPVFPGIHYEEWDIEDPSGLELKRVIQIRDAIRARVEDLLRRFTVGETR